jgi:hypothetical protein
MLDEFSIYDPIGNDWLSITDDMLDEFRTNLTHIYKFNSVDPIHTTLPSATPSPLSAATISSSLSSQSPVDLFKLGIKRDFNAIPTLKDEKNKDQWHCTFTNMARAQDLSDVLNPKYVPQTTTAYDLFWEKQKFLYAVLEAKVETVKGKSIIRQYKSMYDAQKAYKRLEEHHLRPNTTMFAANKIMEYHTTVRINDRSWHGTLENFLSNWQEQFRHYKRWVPAASHYWDEQKLVMLQVTVHPLRKLRQVKNTALLIKQANSGKDLMYDEYVQLLTHAASDYNNVQIKAKGKRQVYIHDINDDTFDTYDDATSEYEPLTLIHLFIQYKHMLRTTVLHPIEVIITTEFECPKTDGSALMIRPRQFGIA